MRKIGCVLGWFALATGLASCGDEPRIVGPTDTTPPTVVTVVPADGATGVASSTDVRAKFSEDIAVDGITEETFFVTQNGETVPGTRSVDGADAVFTPDAPFVEGAQCVATVAAGIEDLAGNGLAADVTWTFDVVDVVGPSVVSTLPASGATGMSTGVILTLTFNEAIDPATVTESSFTLTGPDGLVPGTRLVSGAVATLTPAAPLDEGAVYTANVTTDILDLAGNALVAPHEWSFTTGAEGEMGVASISPEDSAIGVSTATNVVITFSEPIDPASVTGSSVSLSAGGSPVTAALSVSGAVVTLNPTVRLDELTLHTVTITTGVIGLSGAVLPADATFTFTTADETSPSVLSVDPANGSAGVARTTPVTITFSEMVDAATVTDASFYLEPLSGRRGGTVPGTISVTGAVATFTPDDLLMSEVPYRVMVTGGVRDLAGNALDGMFFSAFITIDDEPPVVVSVTPSEGEASAPVNADVRAVFDDDIAPSSIDATSFVLRDAGENVIPGTLTVSGDEVRLNPTLDLEGESTYTATLTTDVTDNAGNALAAPFTWSFTTADENLPFVVSTTPADGAVDVVLDILVTATFSEDIDPATVTAASFALSDAGGTPVSASVSAQGATVSLDPVADLDPETTYTARLTTDIQDAAGNAMASPFEFTFTTADVSGPTVVSTVPGDDEEDVAPSIVVTASFSEDVDPATVDASSFTLESAGGAVTGSVSASGSTASFDPASDLASDTEYTARLSTSITDTAGNPLEAEVSWRFRIADINGPVVVSVAPPDGATDVPVAAPVSATFSEDIDPASVTAASFTLKNDGGSVVPATLSTSGPVVTLTPTSDLDGESTFTARLETDITDLAGNPLSAPVEWSFKTADVDGPVVLATAPADGETDVTASIVTVDFSEPIDPASVTNATFKLFDDNGAVAGTVSASGSTAIFEPTGGFASGVTVTARLTTAITDEAGNPLRTDYLWSFTTADVTPPEVVSTTPGDGATDVGLDVVIQAVFSEDVDPSTVTTSSFLVTYGAGMTVSGTVEATGDTASFTPTGLVGGTRYTVTLTTAVRDLAGNPLATPYVWTFTTLDSDVPFVVSTDPADTETDVEVTRSVTAVFSEDIDPASVTTTSFVLEDESGTPVAAARSVDGATATLDPAADLDDQAVYTARLTTEVRDLAGNALAESFEWTFTTADVTPPTVVSTNPADGAIDVDPAIAVTIEFSEPVDPTSAAGAVTLFDLSTGEVAGTVSTTDSTVTFTPDVPLVSEQTYEGRVSTGLTDLAGNALAAPVQWQFTVADVVPPVVVLVFPGDGATNVGIDIALTAEFDEALDPSTVNGSTFLLEDSGGAGVAGTVELANQLARFTPTDPLDTGETYTATLTTGIEDLAGNALAAPVTWSFTTELSVDDVPPTVVSSNPADGVTVAPPASVTVTMSEPIDPASVTTSTFQLRAGGLSVLGAVSVLDEVLTFTPTNPLAGSWQYEIVVTVAVTDLAGNPLETEWRAAFFTSPSSAPIVFNADTGSYYHVVEAGPISWTQARDDAAVLEHLGVTGRLATLTDPDEEIFLPAAGLNLSGLWLGGRQAAAPSEPAGDWQWLSGEEWSYTNWRAGQPDDAGGEDHLRVDAVGVRWDDANEVGADVRGYLVEYETVPPVVTNVFPSAGATNVRLDVEVAITFSEPVDPSSITSSTVLLLAPGDVPVPATLDVTADGTAVSLVPDAPLDHDTVYTGRVTTGVTDVAGNALVALEEWTFQTTPPPFVGEPQFEPTTSSYFQLVIFYGGRTWDEANTYARAQVHSGIAGQLAAIDNAGVQLFLLTSLDNEIPLSWIGGRQICNGTACEPDQNWRWVKRTGEVAISFFNWASGQPNDPDGAEDYLLMRPSGKWEDVVAEDARVTGVIVQYPMFGREE